MQIPLDDEIYLKTIKYVSHVIEQNILVVEQVLDIYNKYAYIF